MQLWTEYEGVTIDGAFPLKKLLLPEGRSAFFSTAGPNGEPTVVRLIECHFDEKEFLARWRCVEALNHPNFLKFERYGQIELDGGPVVYAVFQKVDANLAEVLDQGHLTVKDAAQLTSSLVAALDVLHTNGFVHEHIEPRNVFAVGEVVKLRGDCIRDAPEGEEGRAAKQRDVRDLATVLLQALTQRQSLADLPDFAVPPPFADIIRNGLNGTWGLENIRAALDGHPGSTPRVASGTINAAPAPPVAPATPTASASPAVPPSSVAPVVPVVSVPFDRKAASAAPKPSARPEAQLPLPLIGKDLDEDRKAKSQKADFSYKAIPRNTTTHRDIWDEERSFSLRSRWAGALCIVAVLLLLSIWGVAHAWNAHRQKATQAASTTLQTATQSMKQAAAKQLSTSRAPRPVVAALPHSGLHRSASSRADWRVIVFTYNRRTDAETKVASLARSHPNLQPQVFTAHGRAPYLVSIGGIMDRDAAYALARRARSLGLPHDTYAQNYSH